MKKLTQAVFDLPECPKWAKSAGVQGSGEAGYFDVEKQFLDHEGEFLGYAKYFQPSKYYRYQSLGLGYDTTNWQQSAINRGEQ